MEFIVQIINQVAELNQKLIQEELGPKFERNLNRLFSIFEEQGYICSIPLGEKYNDARTDCTANVVGNEGKNMIITQVIKPIVYHKSNGTITLLQKGIVMVENI